MDWSISESSFRCVHKSGAIVYFDPHITSSGALRCVGPFHVVDSNCHFIRSIMRELTLHLEEKFCEEQAYVLWGTYEDLPHYQDHEFLIHGAVCGHVPTISLRADILGPSLANEWAFDGKKYLHRSGLTSQPNVTDKIDKSAFHPLSVSSEVEMLLSHLRKQHADFQVRSEATPLLKWAARNISPGAEITPLPRLESPLVHLEQRVR